MNMPPRYKQSNFLDLVHTGQKQGEVYQDVNGRFVAEIAGGWWRATRNNKKDAIEAVIRIYHKEIAR